MKTKKRISILFVILITLGTVMTNAQELKLAMVNKGDVGSFFNGLATVQDGAWYEKKYSFINARGENIGKAPGILEYADEYNRIFKAGFPGEYMLANTENKRVSRKYAHIKYISQGLFFARTKNFKYCILNRNGEVLWKKKHDCFRVIQREDSPFIAISSRDGKFNIYKNGRMVMSDCNIKEYTLSPAYPVVLGDNKMFFKKTGKIIETNTSNVIVYPFVNFIANMNNTDGTYDYYDLEGCQISQDVVNRSSKGFTVRKIGENEFVLLNEKGERVDNNVYDNVDPLYWQSDLLAISKNGKWGYLASDGTIVFDFLCDRLNTCIDGWVVIKNDTKTHMVNFRGDGKNVAQDTIGKIVINELNYNLNEFYYDYIDEKLLLMCNYDTKYACINLTDNWAWDNLTDYPKREKYYYTMYSLDADNKLVYKVGLLSGGGACLSAYNEIKYVGDSLFVSQDESDNYTTRMYNINNLQPIFDFEKYKIEIKGEFRDGIAKVYFHGGIPSDDKWPYYYGYMYNVFSDTCDDIVAKYGKSIHNTLKEEQYIKERASIMDYYVMQGQLASDKNNYQTAIDWYDRAIQLYSYHTKACLGKASVLMHLCQYQEASSALAFIHTPEALLMKAKCSYHLGEIKNALKYSEWVLKENPNSTEAQEIFDWAKSFGIDKEEKKSVLRNVLNIASEFLNTTSAVLNTAVGVANIYNVVKGNTVTSTVPTMSNTASSKKSNISTKQEVCSFCNGTGMNPAKERPAFYNSSEEMYESAPCEVCGSRTNHYHKSCPSCLGKGYKISAF